MRVCLRTQVIGVLAIVALALASAAGWADPPGREPPAAPTARVRTLRLPETPYHYATVELPAHFRTPLARALDNTPRDNPVTNAGATLGRVLFYDTRLSANNTVACASCHHQKHAFADPNRFSKGFEGKFTDRHAPTLVDVRYYQRGRFFWDERAATLEAQVLKPIQSKVEMGQELPKLAAILAKDEHYPGLFKQAFGDDKITSDRLAQALAQFVRSLVSYRSKYDEGLAKARVTHLDFENFTSEENHGKHLFLDHCAICHVSVGQSAHFFTNRPLNNGLDADARTGDGGVGDLTLNPRHVGLFKSPSLRNVAVTGPYMHDGRFDTLEKVVEHYSKGVQQHPNLDGRLRRPRNFTRSQQAALVAFLKTLTDTQFITDPKYSDPFQ
jgi:cytochrome c peroxidase